MIIFAADNHYGVHPGLCAFEEIRGAHPDIIFSEDDWSIFNRYNLAKDCELLILNMIGAALGYLIYKMTHVKRLREKTNNE